MIKQAETKQKLYIDQKGESKKTNQTVQHELSLFNVSFCANQSKKKKVRDFSFPYKPTEKKKEKKDVNDMKRRFI